MDVSTATVVTTDEAEEPEENDDDMSSNDIISTDPYERKLLFMFKSFANCNDGTLDEEALKKLCNSLELGENQDVLINSLLRNRQLHVTFKEFKEALLDFLGNELERNNSQQQHQEDKSLVITQTSKEENSLGEQRNTTEDEIIPNSPGREISPKLVVGNKKYGRRSRPQSLVIDSSSDVTDSDGDEENDISSTSLSATVGIVKTSCNIKNKSSQKFKRSSSQSDLKRRPGSGSSVCSNGGGGGTKLKRCASLPAQKQQQKQLRCHKIHEKYLSKQQTNSLITTTTAAATTTASSSSPTHSHQIQFQSQNPLLSSSAESLGNLDFENLSHKIYKIWQQYENELNTNQLNRLQLQKVCENVGLTKRISYKISEEVFDKLQLNVNETISFNDFIALIQNNDTTTATSSEEMDKENEEIETHDHFIVNGNCKISKNALITTISMNDHDLLHINNNNNNNNLLRDHSTVMSSLSTSDSIISVKDYSASEIVPVSDIIEMWSSIGVNQPKVLLSNLGYDEENTEIDISHLLTTLEEELRGLQGESQISVLKAALILRKTEVTSLQQILHQLFDENRKLRSDNKDANRRAAMLAQEIDERHANLEEKTKNEIKILEQRHAEIIRELTTQLANDREHWSNLNSRLEDRVKILEHDEQRLKNDLQLMQDENSALENEQIQLQKQITDLLEANIKLNNDIVELEDRQRLEDGQKIEKETEEVLELIDKITSLQIENTNLRDKNDELVAEIESLNLDLQKFKNYATKKNFISQHKWNLDLENITIIGEDDTEQTTLGGIKRRGDSPSKIRHSEEESPRLGKLRKCNDDDNNNQNNENNSENEISGDWITLNAEMNSTLNKNNNNNNMTSPATTPSTGTSGFSQPDFSSISIVSDTEKYENEIQALNEKISKLQIELKELKQKEQQEKTDEMKSEKMPSKIIITTNETDVNANDDHNKKTENEKINATKNDINGNNTIINDEIDYKIRCKELEDSLEQMRKAYEECEDYWQGKLNEERQLFEKERQIYEEEQHDNDKKFKELMEKIQEYEEQLVKDGVDDSGGDGRLTPIEENDILEQQYADLEREFEEYKVKSKNIIEEKTKEITDLNEQIKELKNKLENVNCLNTTVNSFMPSESIVNNESAASSPISYLWSQSTIQEPACKYNMKNSNWNTNTIEMSATTSRNLTPSQSPITPTEYTSSSCISPIQRPTSTGTNGKNEMAVAPSITPDQIEIEINSNPSLSSSPSATSSKSHETYSSYVSAVASLHSSIGGSNKISVIPEFNNTANNNNCVVAYNFNDDNINGDNQSPNVIREEIRKLKLFETQLKDQVAELIQKRNSLIIELQQLQDAKPILEKAYTRSAHPTLIQRVNQLEQKNRHLQNVIRQQQQYTDSIMHQSWQQQRQEVIELRKHFDAQNLVLTDQSQRLTQADLLIKDLHMENSHLTAIIQRMEYQQQQQQQQQQRNRAAFMQQQHQGLTGMP